ncbi:hypothetical protein JG688_00006869 [Phytophthora aleatoria]|uniref:Uncharacterized protein n=1 Tax=Phytophthora aleatoria TaxID=2496075 RepID=A0A8J5J0F7_9STRA|nr:hypothetical protein JG688_00006869 [Phytophthora aleatoria]
MSWQRKATKTGSATDEMYDTDQCMRARGERAACQVRSVCDKDSPDTQPQVGATSVQTLPS